MKKLLNEFFNVSEHCRISEKAILLRLVTTIAVIMFCLIAMGTTAFAYFSHDITSQNNIIKSANFEALIQITSSDGQQIAVNSDNRTVPYADIKANTTYFVKIKHSERSTAKTGFIILTADRCESRYHTQQLGKDSNGNSETFTFTVTPNNDTRVTFLAHWGTSSYYGYKNTDNPLYITKNNNDIKLPVAPPLMITPEESTSSETTAKAPEQTSPQKPANTTTPEAETKKPAEITVPETTGSPSPTNTQKPSEPATDAPVATETTAPETSYTTPETTTPEHTVPETTTPETTAPKLPAEIHTETTLPDSPETSGDSTKETNG